MHVLLKSAKRYVKRCLTDYVALTQMLHWVFLTYLLAYNKSAAASLANTDKLT